MSHHNHGTDPHRVHHHHVPYWKRAHTDWRFWIGVILMLGAMIVYVMSLDLRWQPRNQPQPAPSAETGK
jgi:hypothetical protein